MVVDSVLNDGELTHAAVRVFANLVRNRKRGTARTTIGLPLLAEKSKCSISTTRLALAQLEERKHIKTREGRKTDRRTYLLLSNRFRQSIIAEAGGETLEYYRDADGIQHKRIVKAREMEPRPAVSRPRIRKQA